MHGLVKMRFGFTVGFNNYDLATGRPRGPQDVNPWPKVGWGPLAGLEKNYYMYFENLFLGPCSNARHISSTSNRVWHLMSYLTQGKAQIGHKCCLLTLAPMSVWRKEPFNLCSHYQNKLWLAYKSPTTRCTVMVNKLDSVPVGLILIWTNLWFTAICKKVGHPQSGQLWKQTKQNKPYHRV